MLQSNKLIIRKYTFDNTIDYIDDSTEFGQIRLERAIAEAFAIAKFYKDNPDNDVMEKDIVSVLSRMSERSLYVAVLERLNSTTGNIESNFVASSMVTEFYFPVSGGDALKTKVFVEAGGMRCILNGFNIQKLMHAVRIIDRLTEEPNGFYFGATYGDAEKSPFNLTKMGFVEVDVYPELVDYRLFQIDHERDRGVKYFRPNLDLLSTFAELITELNTGKILNRKFREDLDRESDYLWPNIDKLDVVFDRGFRAAFFEVSKVLSENDFGSLSKLSSLLGTDIDRDFILD